jgi:hypothetical protein
MALCLYRQDTGNSLVKINVNLMQISMHRTYWRYRKKGALLPMSKSAPPKNANKENNTL